MAATQSSYWTAYCQRVGRNPCTPTSVYPVQPETAMVGEPGDFGVADYVSQSQTDGAIGYIEYSSAKEIGFPVAKVLNAAGYYTAPTPGNVGVSLLNAQINTNPSDPLYGTVDLSQVYTDPDPRTYEQVDQLGYAALPINLVEAGYAQLQKIPGASLPATTTAFIASCNNPTFSADGTNILAQNDPMPPACDQQGATQCATGGAVDTTTSLTASPNPATVGESVTLTAAVAPVSGLTTPAGTVRFEVGGTAIGSPATVTNGAATTTTTFAAAGMESLSAAFTPADPTAFSASAGKFSLTLAIPASQAAGPYSGGLDITSVSTNS